MMQAPAIAIEMHKAHLARVRRIEAAAVRKVEPVVVVVEPAPPPPPVKSWEERQREIPIPTVHWFSIIEDHPVLESRAPLVEDIQRVACRYFEVKRNDLLSPRRCQRIAYPRQVAFYLAKTLTRKSRPDIGRRFGGRDHTTILHGYRKIEGLIKSDWLVAYDVAHVEMML
jgi:hypothetical protein